jgi:hypothetical protein
MQECRAFLFLIALRLRGDYVQAAKVDKKGATATPKTFRAEARARQPKLLARLFMVRTQ